MLKSCSIYFCFIHYTSSYLSPFNFPILETKEEANVLSIYTYLSLISKNHFTNSVPRSNYDLEKVTMVCYLVIKIFVFINIVSIKIFIKKIGNNDVLLCRTT